MAVVRHLGFVWGIFGPPTESTWVLCHLAKFGYDQCLSFCNMMVSIFGAFGRKTLIDAPEIGVFGQFDPLNGLQILTKAKIRHMLA